MSEVEKSRQWFPDHEEVRRRCLRRIDCGYSTRVDVDEVTDDDGRLIVEKIDRRCPLCSGGMEEEPIR